MSETDFHFTFHFSIFQYPLSQDTATTPSSYSADFELKAVVYFHIFILKHYNCTPWYDLDFSEDQEYSALVVILI